MSSLHRRSFLKAAVTTAAGAGLMATARAGSWMPALAERKTKHVVLIAFAGGVRSRETFGTPENIPNLAAMAEEGVLYPRTRCSNLGHFGAALSLFTGISEARGIRENARGEAPTLFEYVRKGLGLPASEVWISTSGGAQQTNYSYGTHRDFGPRYGANTLDGDGLFNEEFKQLIESFGRPRQMGERESELLGRMRGQIERSGALDLNSPESAARVENYILTELTSGTSDIRGANAADAKALRVARNLLVIFKPRLVSVVLQQADIAHGSFNGYAEVIRQNDAAIGELWDAVKGDPLLRETTTFCVLPEFGRDRDLNSRRGLDHGDGSDDLNYVSTVCWGPDFKRGQVVRDDVRAIDVCPTICDLLGTQASFARGKRLPRLFA